MYDEDLKNLEDGIRRLKIEYDIFFTGNRKKPPEDLRLRVDKLVKRLAEATDLNFSQRFLYNTLIARFYVYKDLWRRTLRDHESAEGPAAKHTATPHKAQSNAPAPTPPREVQVSISDPSSETTHVRRLYEELIRLKAGSGKEAPGISYQQFADYIANQTQGIRKKYQCASVTFRIALEENNVKFTAKAGSNLSG